MSVYIMLKSILLIITLILALYHDIREQKIRNYTTYSAALLGLTINIAEQGWDGLGFSLIGWLIPVTVLGLFYITNTMGAGDIKLFAAIGATMGLPFTVYSFAYSVYFGGLIAFIILFKRKQLRQRMYRIYEYLCYIAITRRIPPYCVKADKESKFIFSTAIVPGTILHLSLMVFSNQYHYALTKELGTWLKIF